MSTEDHRVRTSGEAFDIADLWPRLSLKARRRWWRETDYSRKPASDELIAAMRADAAGLAAGGAVKARGTAYPRSCG